MPADATSHSPEETCQIARELACTLTPGTTVALSGELGTGKTTLVRGIVMALHGDAHEVTSPTFTLMNVYDGTPPVYHFDWYRLDNVAALGTTGFEEYLEGRGCARPGISVIEWAEKFPDVLPPQTRWIRITMDADGTRHFTGI